MDILTCDFETYYDSEFSLSKMQTDAYVADRKFEVIGVCVAVNDQEPQWFSGDMEETAQWLHQFDWDNSAVRCHNTMFDGYIFTHRFGIKPRLWLDTLAQGRMLRPYLHSHSLANLAKHFGLEPKGTEVQNALGKRRLTFNPMELAAYAEYCKHDTALCRDIGTALDKFSTPLQFKLIDMTVRMFTEPAFVGDRLVLRKLYDDEVTRKDLLLSKAAIDRDVIMSNDKFARMLEEHGVMPPRKVSKTTGKETWAFAKTDKEFTDLQDHDDPTVQALVAARLGVKTTIAETRALKFVEMAERGPLPVYLNFWGAKTTGRYSGGNFANWQNLPARGPSAGIRKALMAPPAHSVVVGDSSNIELRTVMALAGQDDVLDKLRNGVDLYCDFAGKLFGCTITKADAAERQLGKVAMLSLQYGAGAERFMDMVRVAARSDPKLKPITLDRAQDIVNLYREVHDKVVRLWGWCADIVLPNILSGRDMEPVDVHGWFITQWDGFGRPGEAGVVYHDLQHDRRSNEWTYQMGKQRVRIYGPKVVENLSQHAAMLIVMWQTARINQRYPVKLSVHDEAVTIVPDEQVDDAVAYMTECLSMAPPWCRAVIPVSCEVGVGKSYGDAK